MRPSLERCPCCGGEAIHYKFRRENWAGCDNCGLRTVTYRTAMQAAETWNRLAAGRFRALEHNRSPVSWISVDEDVPIPTDRVLLVAVSGKPRENITLHHAVELAVYRPVDSNGWILEAWPDWQEPEVSHWMELPPPPVGVESDACEQV